VSALGALAPPALAETLSEHDRMARLAAGEVVAVPLDLELPQGDYFGGISYAVIRSPVDVVMKVLLDPASWGSILPMTVESKLLGRRDQDMRVFLRQGGKLGTAAYVLLVRRESLGTLRFWLDPKEPHEIADCWGYFRVQPWGKESALLTYAALLRLDFGPVKLLFSEKIRSYALSTPRLVRDYVQERVGVAAMG
jgi:hypothetical protein